MHRWWNIDSGQTRTDAGLTRSGSFSLPFSISTHFYMMSAADTHDLCALAAAVAVATSPGDGRSVFLTKAIPCFITCFIYCCILESCTRKDQSSIIAGERGTTQHARISGRRCVFAAISFPSPARPPPPPPPRQFALSLIFPGTAFFANFHDCDRRGDAERKGEDESCR